MAGERVDDGALEVRPWVRRDHRGDVVGENPGFLRHPLDELARTRIVAHLPEQLLKPAPTEDPAGHAGVHQAVGEETRDCAGHQRHRRLSQARWHPDPDRR